MSRNCFGSGVAVLAVFFAFAYAGDKNFWATKPYTEWSEKEAQKLLKDSPWSKSVTIGFAAMGSTEGGLGADGSSGGRGGGSSRGGEGGMEGGGMGGGGMGRGGRGGRGGDMGASSARASEVVVIWYSLPVRQAMARHLMLRQPETPKERLDKLLEYTDTAHFTIFLSGMTGRARGAGEETIQKLMNDTYLEKKNKQKIPVASIIPPKGRGEPWLLRFPTEANRLPTLILADKEVTLRTRMGQSDIRAKFKLADMVINGELAL